MSKELTPLEAWERANNNAYEYGYEISGDLCYIIETALKRLESIDNNYCVCEKGAPKKLLALEIIKEKNVNVRAFKKVLLMLQNDDVRLRTYNSQNRRDEDDLIQEEYDLLKEVFR